MFFFFQIGLEDARQTPLNDETDDGGKKSSRSPSPVGTATTTSKVETHDRTPSLSPEPDTKRGPSAHRDHRGDSKLSSRYRIFTEK